MTKTERQHHAISIIRIMLALTMIIHGMARVTAGGVAPFGGFLESRGFSLGLYLAWAVTIFELVGGLVFLLGYLTPILSVLFALQLLMGIILVHGREGWFVVGLGRNGMEYSVLLIVLFFCVAIASYGKEKRSTHKD